MTSSTPSSPISSSSSRQIELGDAAVAGADTSGWCKKAPAADAASPPVLRSSDDKAGGGACAPAAGGDARTRARKHYAAARRHLEAARDAYVKGFHADHPKVAWALEGLGRLHEKCGDLAEALEAYRQASEIRRSAQARCSPFRGHSPFRATAAPV